MSYNVNFGCWNSVFAVPKKVADKLKLASAYQLKVILFVLSHGGQALNDDYIGKQLNMHPNDVKDSILYWVENGVISLKDGEITQAAVENFAENGETEEFTVDGETMCADTINCESNEKDALRKPQFTVTRTERPDSFYVAQLLSENNEIKLLMDEVQTVLGKTLSSGDIAKIVMLYDTAGLPADVILMLINYCLGIGKGNMLAIEKMGVKWANEGINTLEFAEEKIKQLTENNDAWHKVCSIFGIKNIGSPTQKQLQFAGVWVNEWNFSDEMLREAYERCVDAKGEYKLPYINAILKKWHKAGLYNLDDVFAAENTFNTKANVKTSSKKVTSEQAASYNLDEIENKSMFDD